VITSNRSSLFFFTLRSLLIPIAFLATAASLNAQSPVAEWRFDEGSGNIAFDASGNGNQARLSNGIRWIHGPKGWAVSVDSTKRGVISSAPIDFSATRAITVSTWVNRNYSADEGVLIQLGSGDIESNPGFALLPDDETCHGLRAVLHGNGGLTANCYAQPSSGVWHNLAIVYDKTQTGGDQISLYVDGVPQSPTWNLASAANTDNFGNDPIYLFSRAGVSQFSSGALRDVRIYDQALTGGEIQQINDGGFQQLSSSQGISFVQGNFATPQTPQTSVAVKFNSAQNAGDLNVVVVGWNDSTATVSRVADSKGNTYTRAVGPTVQTGYATQSIYYAKNIAAAGAGANTVTVTFSTGAASPDIRILEYSGADPNNPVDVTAASSGTSTASNSGSATTTNATDLIFGANLVQTLTTGPGVNFTSRILTLPDGDIAEDRWVTATGSYSATAPDNPSGPWIMQMVAFRTPVAGNYTISASPSSLSVAQGHTGTSTITTTVSGGFNSAITLSASGVPTGTTVTFSPNPIAAPGSGTATMTIAVGSTTPMGTYPLTVTGNGGGVQQSTTVTLTVTAGPAFTISASPSSLSISPGNHSTSTITTAISNGFNSSISLSASGAPTGTTVSFSTNPIPAPGSGSSTMTITVGSGTTAGTYPITVTGNGGGIQQSTTVTLTVVIPTFTISASPSALTISTGHQGTSAITTAISGGFNSAIALSATGAPSGTTVSFNPTSIPAPGSGTSTMTITVGTSTPTGSYSITVTGSGGGVQQSTVVTLTVTSSTSTIAYVQGNYATPQSPESTVSVVYTAAQTAGDLNVVAVGWNDSSATVSSVTDSSGNQYTRAVGPTIVSGYISQSIYYAKNIHAAGAGGNTVTVAFSTAATSADVRIVEYSGADPNNPVDVTAASSGNSASTSSGSATTTNPTDLIFGANIVLTTTSGPGSGFTSRLLTQPDGDIAEDQMTSSAGSYSAAAPLTSSGYWIMQMVAFRTPVTGNFTISASPSSLSIVQGSQGTSTITTAISGGFDSSIALSATGTPSGVTLSFSQNPITAPGSGSSIMTISVGITTPTGTYPITVTGNGGGIQHSATVTLTVTAGTGFSVSASPSSLTVMQETQGTSTITVTVSGGFNSSISLAASGLPSGTTVSFNPATLPAPGSGTSTMTITVGTTAQGTYPITITATGGGSHQTATVNLTVTAEVMLSWTASQSPGIAGYNIYRGTISGGPYTKINSSLDTTTTYNDMAVQDGVTYYYVTTAVNNEGQESSYSNQSSATVP
jgi:uncharacterized membrane protein